MGDRVAPQRERPAALAMLWRGAFVVAHSAVLLVPALLAVPLVRLARGPATAAGFGYRNLVRQIERLGPTYVKFGQILATRRDVLPAALCVELGRLHDRTRPLTPRRARAALRRAYAGELDRVFETVDRVPMASGSIACVYRAVLRDGREVALKLQRPGIRRRMVLDLAILGAVMSAGERLPAFTGVPLRELAGYVCAAIERQLDFDAERASLARLRANLAHLEYVRVPETLPELCRPRCVVMELLPGLVPRPVAGIEPARRRALAARLLGAVFHMLFMDGFVHCDLHPGNVYFVGPRVVILDAGFSVQLPGTVRRSFADFFLGLALGRGRQCGEIVLGSAARIGADADVAAFVAGVADLVARSSGRPVKDFKLMEFAVELFDLQRRHGLYAAAEFVFPLMSLLVIEGTVRELDPDADFQAAARPLLLRAGAKQEGPGGG